MTEAVAQLLLSIEDAAEVLGVGLTTTKKLVRDGKLETVRIGRRNLVVAESTAAYVESLRNAEVTS